MCSPLLRVLTSPLLPGPQTQAFRGTTMRLRVFLCASSSVPAPSVTRLHDSLQTSLREMRIRGQIVVRVLDEMKEQVTCVEGASDDYVARWVSFMLLVLWLLLLALFLSVM